MPERYSVVLLTQKIATGARAPWDISHRIATTDRSVAYCIAHALYAPCALVVEEALRGSLHEPSIGTHRERQ